MAASEVRKGARVWSMAAVLLLAGVSGCYKDLPVQEARSVATFRDPDTGFASLDTYYLADSVLHVGGGGLVVTRAFDSRILDRTEANLLNLGYRRVQDLTQESADVMVLVYAPDVAEWYAFSAFQWWGSLGWVEGLEAWRAARYPITFPWRPAEVYEVGLGTIAILMLDLRTVEETGTLPALWLAGISGLLADAPSRVESRLVRTIDQAFVQSPYLETGP